MKWRTTVRALAGRAALGPPPGYRGGVPTRTATRLFLTQRAWEKGRGLGRPGTVPTQVTSGPGSRPTSRWIFPAHSMQWAA